MFVPSNAQCSGSSLVQSANPTPYDVLPMSSCSPWNPRPARRMTRFARPSVLGNSSTTPEIELPDRKARLTPASRALVTLSNMRSVQYLVMADREEHFGAEETLRISVGVDVRDIGNVVAFLFSQKASGNSVIRNSPDPLVSE